MPDTIERTITFSGCWTCKARKVKCDENPRGCAGCARVGLPCGGYDIKLQWVSGKAGGSSRERKSSGIGRRKIRAGWPDRPLQLDQIDRLLCILEDDAGRGVSSTHGPFSSFPTGVYCHREWSLDTKAPGHLPLQEKSTADEPTSTDYHDAESIADTTSSNQISHPVHTANLTDRAQLPKMPNTATVDCSKNQANDWTTNIIYNPMEAGVTLQYQPQLPLSNDSRTNALFHHYIHNVANVLQPLSHPNNPYRSVYAPVAIEGSSHFVSRPYRAANSIELCIFHSLVATAAFHLHRCLGPDSGYHGLGILHRQVALESVQLALVGEPSRLNYKKIMVALLSMITIGVMEGNIIDFHVHLTGIQQLKQPRRKWQLLSSQTRQLDNMSAFLNLLSRTTSIHTSPSPWSAEAKARYDRFNTSSTSDSTYCYEYTYGITVEVAVFIQHTSELAEYLDFYRQLQAPPPDDLLEACESLGDRLLSWFLEIDTVASFSGQSATMLRIFEVHSYAWYHGAVIYYLSRIQDCRPKDLTEETASVAAYLHSAEDYKFRFQDIQMAPITWPAFIASCNAYHREPWHQWWSRIQRYGIGTLKRQYEIVRSIWDETDTTLDGWLDILRRRNEAVLAV